MFIHHRLLTRDRLHQVLERHVGRDAALPIGRLVAEVTGEASAAVLERKARALISELRLEGVAICAHPAHGYWLAANGVELDDCCRFLRSRALHSLAVEARMRKVALPALLDQMVIDFSKDGVTHEHEDA